MCSTKNSGRVHLVGQKSLGNVGRKGFGGHVKDRMLKDRLTTEQGHYILKTDKRQNADMA